MREYVLIDELREIVAEWVELFHKERPVIRNGGRTKFGDLEFISPVKFLVEHTGLSEGSINRVIYKKSDNKLYYSAENAEKILIAIGKEYIRLDIYIQSGSSKVSKAA